MSRNARTLFAPAAAAVLCAAGAPAQAQPQSPHASVQRLVAAGAPGAILLTARQGDTALVAGLLVEAVTRRPLGDVLRARILRPLRLRHTAFALRGDQPLPQAHGFTVIPGGRRVDVTRLTPYSWAAGAIVSTAVDVARFYRALLFLDVLMRAYCATS